MNRMPVRKFKTVEGYCNMRITTSGLFLGLEGEEVGYLHADIKEIKGRTDVSKTDPEDAWYFIRIHAWEGPHHLWNLHKSEEFVLGQRQFREFLEVIANIELLKGKLSLPQPIE